MMKKKRSLLILICVFVVLFLPSDAFAISSQPLSDTVEADTSTDYPYFGANVAFSGDTLIVSAASDEEKGSHAGAVYLFDMSASDITDSRKKLFGSNTRTASFFGFAVAASGHRVAVGAPNGENVSGDLNGTAYVYDVTADDITGSEIMVYANSGTFNDHYAYSVALSGNILAVGAPGTLAFKGVVYLYDLSASDIQNSETIISPTDSGGMFGASLAISGSTLVVGATRAPGRNGWPTGAVYLYDLEASDIRGSQIKIFAGDGNSNEFFGSSIALAQDTLVVGVPNNGELGDDAGAAYIYDLSAGTETKIFGSDTHTEDHFGTSVAISGDNILIGEPEVSSGGNGKAYLFDLSAANIADSEIMFYENNGEASAGFGKSVALSENHIAVGAFLESGDCGRVYYLPNAIITFDKDGGTGGTDSVIAYLNEPAPSAVAPSKAGYAFEGYYSAPDGGGTQYYNADMSSARNWDTPGTTTLYASWTASPYTVTFDKQYGSGGDDSVIATFSFDMPAASAPSKTGFSFAGYYALPYGQGTKYYNADMTSAHPWDIGINTSIYAYWDSNPSATYTVTFNSQGGSAVASQDVAFNGYASRPNDPSKTGFYFGGWYTTSGTYTDTLWNFNSCQVTHDTVLYAKWDAPDGSGVTDIEFDYAYKSVKDGTSGNIASICPYTIYPAAAVDKTVSWTSSNTTVATITGGVLTAHAEGKTVITVTANDTTNGTIQTKMIVEVMDATAVSLSSSGKDIVGQVVDAGGMVLSNYCVTTYSDPLNTLTNSSGEFVFQGIPFTHHTLVVSNSSGNEIGRFSLNFNNTGKQGIAVNNQTNTADISYSSGTNYIDLKFQVNGASNDIDLITSDISGTNMIPNPETDAMASNAPKWLVAFFSLLFIPFYFMKLDMPRMIPC